MFKKVHKFIGLVIAVLVVIQALTGVVLIYGSDLSNWLSASSDIRVERSPEGQGKRLDLVVELLGKNYPDWSANRIEFPSKGGESYLATLVDPSGENQLIQVSLDPPTTKVPDSSVRVLSTIKQIHTSLFAGSIGESFVGVIGLLVAATSIIGLVISWKALRHPRKLFKVDFGINRVRTYFELHRVIGILAFPFIVILSLTGFAIVFTPELGVMMGIEPATTSKYIEGQSTKRPSELLNLARAEFPGLAVRNVRLRPADGAVYRVVFQRNTVFGEAPSHQVWINPQSGEITHEKDTERLRGGESLLGWVYFIHTGTGVGRSGQLVVLVTGIFIIILSIAGLALWATRRRRMLS